MVDPPAEQERALADPPAEPAGGGSPRDDLWWPALASAALPGLGHALLSRRYAALCASTVTATLILVIASVPQPAWGWRVAGGLWWAATAAHAHLLARRAGVPVPATAGRVRRMLRPRTVALAAASGMLVLVGGLVIDARRVTTVAADAHRSGDCDSALSALDGVAARHRLVDPFVTARAERERAACTRLLDALAAADRYPDAAAGKLAGYAAGDPARWPGAAELRSRLLLTAAGDGLDQPAVGNPSALERAFGSLAAVLAETPGQGPQVRQIAAKYATAVSEAPPCAARTALDRLHDRRFGRPELDEPLATLDAKAPPILLACGRQLVGREPERAREVFEALLYRYPHHELAGAAARGAEAAGVRLLLDGWPERKDRRKSDPPEYCAKPAAYRGAPSHTGRGPRRVAVFGEPAVLDALPTSWRATGLDDAALVLCVDGPDHGRPLGTCRYPASRQLRASWAGPAPGEVAATVRLHAATYRIRAYALRTGLLTQQVRLTLTGSCPLYLVHYLYGADPLSGLTDRVWAEDRDALAQAARRVVRPLAGR
ncbi:hypothetical protein ABNF97_11690 [Plantactinospora sp. B6F1]|uniref:hypothetical protein n=1 Tax=Plantactinospora sp. B6F1 TaxID=3158971 RepID=UPI0032D99141